MRANGDARAGTCGKIWPVFRRNEPISEDSTGENRADPLLLQAFSAFQEAPLRRAVRGRSLPTTP